jgi:DNA-binding transcriptional LysR family regulator
MRKQSGTPVLRRSDTREHAAGPFDDLTALMVFARVVQRRSFTAAARELDTSTSAVSKRIARLEQQVGALLLTRTTRQVSPTETGLALYQRCLRILREVEDAELLVAGLSEVPRGLLRVSAPVYFGQLHVAPLLAELLKANPELRLELSLSDRFVDLVAEGFDLAVRIGKTMGASLVGRTLCKVPAIACAAPEYLERRGTPLEPRDLLNHDCLRYTQRTPPHVWHFRSHAHEVVSIPVTGSFDSDHSGALREAAIAGLGVVFLPWFYVAEALERGSLRPILAEYSRDEFSVRGVYPSGKLVPPKTRVCLDYLAQALPARMSRCAAHLPRSLPRQSARPAQGSETGPA